MSKTSDIQKIHPGNEFTDLERELKKRNPKLFDGVSPQKKGEILRTISVLSVQRVYSGPLPTPEDLSHYNSIIPNGADRIMKMAEEQSKHRIQIETTVISKQSAESKRGQLFGLIIGIVGLICGTFLSYTGHEIVGGTIAGTTVIGLVSVFVIGKKKQKQELQEKRSD
jgi:uncharacterized membrane protein